MQLHEQYRPQEWSSVVGQDKAIARFQTVAKRGIGGRCFWITGKSGTGKTGSEYRVVWPIDNYPDTQGGHRRLRKDNTLNHFTATCGQSVFSGDGLPADLVGT